MLTEAGIGRVYLACGPTDLRKSIDGLAALVKEAFELDPFSPTSLSSATGSAISLRFSTGTTTGLAILSPVGAGKISVA
jgi:transposase